MQGSESVSLVLLLVSVWKIKWIGLCHSWDRKRVKERSYETYPNQSKSITSSLSRKSALKSLLSRVACSNWLAKEWRSAEDFSRSRSISLRMSTISLSYLAYKHEHSQGQLKPHNLLQLVDICCFIQHNIMKTVHDIRFSIVLFPSVDDLASWN